MKRFHFYDLIFLAGLMLTSQIYANTEYPVNPSIPTSEVREWTERTLLITLTAGYHEHVSEAANVREHYLAKAWAPIAAYLNSKLKVRDKQVVMLHPKPLTPPVIIATEDCDEASCWRVHQSFLIPEWQHKVDFTVVVATADPSHGSPFVIRDLDLVFSHY